MTKNLVMLTANQNNDQPFECRVVLQNHDLDHWSTYLEKINFCCIAHNVLWILYILYSRNEEKFFFFSNILLSPSWQRWNEFMLTLATPFFILIWNLILNWETVLIKNNWYCAALHTFCQTNINQLGLRDLPRQRENNQIDLRSYAIDPASKQTSNVSYWAHKV